MTARSSPSFAIGGQVRRQAGDRGLVYRTCDCDCGHPCPQGRAGIAFRCTILVRPQ